MKKHEDRRENGPARKRADEVLRQAQSQTFERT
jgi:hypothetical protein